MDNETRPRSQRGETATELGTGIACDRVDELLTPEYAILGYDTQRESQRLVSQARVD